MKRIFLIVIFIVLLAGCSIPKYEGTEDKANDQDNVIENFMEKHGEPDIVNTLIADIDGDQKVENFIVTKNDGLKLWYIDGEGKESVIVDGYGCDYLSFELVSRGEEKHIAFMGYYEPSNTNLWVIRMKEGRPKIVFEFMADWEIRIIPNGFQTVWKKYKDEGGYNLVVDSYLWNTNTGGYLKE